MPAFQAINLEPEENAEEQIDTTKEIHVDEALKRFQTALKLHAQGPRFRDAAGAAYDELFDSEIFMYKEAKTEYDRAERHADGQPEVSAIESFSTGLDIDAGGADGVAATLSQALYLSYKNRGQYFLDKLKDASKSDSNWAKKKHVFYRGDNGREVIDNWTAALDQDPSDPEVWRRAARFAASMGSARLKRFCLEAAIELDDDPAIMEVEPPSLAEGLAGEQLKDHLEIMGDKMALTHPVMAPWVKNEMPALLKQHLDPIPFLPDPTSTLTPPPSSPGPEKQLLEEADGEETSQSVTEVSSWPDLGLQLMKAIEDTGAALRVCDSVLEPSQNTEMVVEDPSSKKKADAAKEKEKAAEKAEERTEQEHKDKEASEPTDGTPKPAEQSQKERSMSIPNRKRSQSVAGIPETPDEDNAVEKRSKRVRRRDTALAEELTDPSTLIAKQLENFQMADQNLFKMVKNALENLGVEDKTTLSSLDEILESCGSEDRTSKLSSLASKDIRQVITNFSEDSARVLLNKKEKATLGLSSFLEHAKTGSQDQIVSAAFDESKGLSKFAENMTSSRSWMTSRDIAYEWVRTISESYASFKWSDTMKTTVVQVLNRADSALYEHITAELEVAAGSADRLADLETVIPMLFELHIDVYERITNPSSVVDYATRMETKYRLDRWLDVASNYVRLLDRPLSDPIYARFLWASVMASSLADNPVREHMLLMWTSLRDMLAEQNADPIHLPNNLVMPTISAAAADREISKLTTMDFFLGLFQEEMESPVHVIETLEPVLNPSSVFVSVGQPGTPKSDTARSRSASPEDKDQEPISEHANQGLRDLWKFLVSSSTELRLFLWSRLGDAYEAIGYQTKRFSCHLKSIEMIVSDLEGETYAKTSDDSRRLLFMRTLKSLDEILIQTLSLALNDSTSFDIIDEDHFRSSASALARASCILHVASMCEDEAQVGITKARSNSTFQSLMAKLRDMQVRAWCLQYTLLKAGAPQQESSLAPENELADLLAAIHRAIGLRQYCKASNKIFLKMMRVELLKLQNVENWENYLGQVLYDLYGLKLGVGVWEVEEHGCPHEDLEKRQAMSLVEKVTILASRMPMKDLLKSDLKTTIDEMQQTIGSLKSTTQMLHNLRNFTELLRKPIHPLRLYQALRGGVLVDAVSVNIPEAALAKHGWFFLFGMIALTKFKGVDLNRRQTPGAIDDLRIGATFLRLQLQFTADRWDAWFRLGECFDYELDEAVLWTADKMNKDRPELVKFQRNAIHCYTLALSNSRNKKVGTFDGDALHDLYHKFGMRLYSSSREPFAMEPFEHSDQERFFIESSGAGTFKRILHDQMPPYKVWKFAAKLFRMAMEREPANWKNPYMLAKCYWKMHKTPVEMLDSKDSKSRITTETVVDTLKTAVEVACNARKSRHSEPILEPHYKIVSVLHKMVMRGDLSAVDAAAILAEQPFGIAIGADDHFASFSEPGDWDEYTIRNLVKLKDKDKSNWQHRIIMRHAKILFDEDAAASSGDHHTAARASFGILKESMFTKTMVMNVWKCLSERPGRHHVYTEQYIRYMTRLLVILSDRVNLELVLRRLRKKGADFYHFTDLWQSCCLAYVKLLRQSYHIGPAVDDVFKSMSNEEFEIMSERITEWAAGDGPHIDAFECMKDTIELKKLNANLMRVGAIDDLINDCYSRIYLDVAGNLPGLEPSKVIEERNHAKEVAAKLEAAEQADNRPPPSLNNILNAPGVQSGVEGTATPQDPEKAEAAPRSRRTAGVRRPDILRKAEAAVVRSTEAPSKAVSKGRLGSMSSGKRGSQTPNLAASDAGSDDEGPDAQVRREAGEDIDVEMGDGEGEGDENEENEDTVDEEDVDQSKLDGGKEDDGESEDGSIHDSADDESDLSDVPDDYDDEMPPGLRFAHLGRAEQSAEASGEEADSESEGDDHEGHDEEETEEEAEEEQEAEEDEAGDEDTEMHDPEEAGPAPGTPEIP